MRLFLPQAAALGQGAGQLRGLRRHMGKGEGRKVAVSTSGQSVIFAIPPARGSAAPVPPSAPRWPGSSARRRLSFLRPRSDLHPLTP